MNQELSNYLLDTLKSIQDFSKEQIPDVISQTIRWEFINSCIFAVVGFAILLSGIYALRRIYKESKKQRVSCEMEFNLIFISILSVFAIIVGLTMFFSNVQTIVQIKVAPKTYLIEYARGLSKGCK